MVAVGCGVWGCMSCALFVGGEGVCCHCDVSDVSGDNEVGARRWTWSKRWERTNEQSEHHPLSVLGEKTKCTGHT